MFLGVWMVALLLAPASDIRVAPLELRLRMVEIINADRKAAGLPAVEYSEELSRAADAHCLDMIHGNYASHWNHDGWKPYIRYAAAGIHDHTSENLHAFWSSDFREDRVWDYMAEGHRGFMAEQPPNDGHRRSILDPRHTHVGIGVAYGAGSLRMIELFGRRYADLEAVPFRARLKDHLVVSGRLLRRSDSLLGISVFHEPLPQSMNRAELNATSSYSLPKEERMERPRLLAAHYSDGSGGTVHVSGRAFQMPLSFWKGKGVYTIAVWIDAGGKTSFIGAMTSVFVE